MVTFVDIDLLVAHLVIEGSTHVMSCFIKIVCYGS